MDDNNRDYHQELMDAACSLWKENNWSYTKLLTQLPNNQRAAVLLGTLNYQVLNGGFYQWYDNGYYQGTNSLLRVLSRMESSCPLAGAVRALVEQASLLIQEAELINESDYYGEEEDDEECSAWDQAEEDREEILQKLSPIDESYWVISEHFMVQAEVFLRREDNIEILEAFLKAHKEALEATSKVPTETPKPRVKLVGEDGNCHVIMAKVVRALRQAKTGKAHIEAYLQEAMSSDYDHLLYVTGQYVDIY